MANFPFSKIIQYYPKFYSSRFREIFAKNWMLYNINSLGLIFRRKKYLIIIVVWLIYILIILDKLTYAYRQYRMAKDNNCPQIIYNRFLNFHHKCKLYFNYKLIVDKYRVYINLIVDSNHRLR